MSGPARELALAMNAIALKNEIPEESGKSGITAWSRLEEIGVPVTVACGDLDLPFIIARSKELADWLPKSRYRGVRGYGAPPLSRAAGGGRRADQLGDPLTGIIDPGVMVT